MNEYWWIILILSMFLYWKLPIRTQQVIQYNSGLQCFIMKCLNYNKNYTVIITDNIYLDIIWN